MDLYKALEEMHVNLEDLPFEQYRARDELPLIQLWARGRADDCVTLPADLETMDLLTTATSRPTLSAAELRLRNDFEEFPRYQAISVDPQRRNYTTHLHELGLAGC